MSQTLDSPTPTLEQASAAIKNGDLPEARRRLLEILQHDNRNHKAWLWLSGITDSPDASLDYARKANELAPNDPSVKSALAWAESRVFRHQAEAPTAARLVERPQRPAEPDLPERETKGRIAVKEPSVIIGPEQDDLGAWFRWLLFVICLVALLAIVGFAIMMRNGRVSQAAPPPIAVIDRSATGQMGPFARAASQRILSTEQLPPIVVEWETPPVTARVDAADSAEMHINAEPPSTDLVEQATRQLASSGLLSKNALLQSSPFPSWSPPKPPPPPIRENPQEASAEPINNLPVLVNSSSTQFNEFRWIDVNLTTQVLTAYENGKAVLTTYISSGAPGMETVTGQFRIYARYDKQHMTGYHLGYDYSTPDVPHVQYFYGNFGLHGAYWHEDFGTPVSHGCVNLNEPDAAWLYNFAGIGTLVNVHY